MTNLYIAPKAELIFFAPVENIADWDLDKGNKSWTFFNHWGSLGTKENNSATPVSGVMNWYDDLTSKTIEDLD